MRSALIHGLIGAAIVPVLQFLSMTWQPLGAMGAILFYSPMLLYFAFIYASIRRTKSEQPDQVLPFKVGLKAGGITAFIICFAWAIGFFIGLTHQDIRGIADQMIANGQAADIPKMLESYNRQHMFDVTKFWSMPNFLLGFMVIVLATVILARKKKA